MIAYKFLRTGAVGRYSGFRWPTPADGAPGKWVAVEEPLRPAANGIHACRPEQLPYWLDAELWETELDRPVQEHARVVLSRRGRLLRRVEAWDAAVAREFTCDCAERTRAYAVAALRSTGAPEHAESLDTNEGATALMGAAAAAAEDAPEPLATALLDAADVAFATRGEMSACLAAFLAARAARSTSAARGASGVRADREERRRQYEWLSERLGLAAE